MKYRILLVALLACLQGRSITLAEENTTPKRPNVVILYADDLGHGDLGCYNAKSKIPTPHLDELAKQGLRFTDAHSSSGICTPSRYALLTGRYHWREFHTIVQAFGASVFTDQSVTLGDWFQTSGYQTAAIGKWHLGWDWSSVRKPDAKPIKSGRRPIWSPDSFDWDQPIADGPNDHGFDYYFGDTVINFPPYAWIENDRVTAVPDRMLDTDSFRPIKEGKWECRPGPMVKDWNPYDVLPTLTEKGVGYIRSQKKQAKPFFLYFAFPSPHAPIIPNDKFDGQSDAGAYGDFVCETDDCVGRLLAALKETGLDENTIVIFTADNGPEKYAYARDTKFDHWSSQPYRGLKRDLYEGGHHVPMIVRWPKRIQANATTDALTSQVDIFSTLASLLGAETRIADVPSEAIDSVDQSQVWLGQRKQIRSQIVHNTHPKSYAVREDDNVLIMAKDGYVSSRNKDWEKRRGYAPDDKQPMELFDLSVDPQQKRNLASTKGQTTTQLRTRWNQISRFDGSPFRLVSLPNPSSIRGLSVTKKAEVAGEEADQDVVWACGTLGGIYRSVDSGRHWQQCGPKAVSGVPVDADFRSLHAWDEDQAIVAIAGQPAKVLKTTDGGTTWVEVFQVENKDAFIDGIQFLNANEGILFGDPIDGKWMVAVTHDAGEHWMMLPDTMRPDAIQNEAGFAASNTSMVLSDQQILIGTGGKAAKSTTLLRGTISRQPAPSVSWERVETPLLSDASRGIFSVCFAPDSSQIFAVGGNYKPSKDAGPTSIQSDDGGKTWKAVASAPQSFQSCIVAAQVGEQKLFVSVGNDADLDSTIHVSIDGVVWKTVPNPAGVAHPGFHVAGMGKRDVYLAGSKGQVARSSIQSLIDFATDRADD